ncbi:TIGR02281 family clan AA aspartic protease [Hyphomonas sp. WL0036]|uniref:retropepsin-like aspartic protease family protein n=1 Tax=Hyphomonas sediminis TaxID=2866160 RepID=UPI001C8023C6|nr:TIGR02281 family clan AA aspartic protease [Hyphomonas sediminis]MBY9067911.1 TIGR02281 family clan AA aspartic protease [Hyphomonas sediminis]
MGAGRILSVIAVAVLIAMVIGLYLAPKLREAEYQAAVERQRSAQTLVASAASDSTSTIHTRAAFIEREADGHYWTRADVQGTEVKFMVDTGASIVALTYRDAQRLGLAPETLTYDSEIRTAGGVTYGASIMLDSIRIGRVEVEGVSAVILREELEQSLLGMTFLSELNSYEFRKGQLIIRQ